MCVVLYPFKGLVCDSEEEKEVCVALYLFKGPVCDSQEEKEVCVVLYLSEVCLANKHSPS